MQQIGSVRISKISLFVPRHTRVNNFI
jgi:hypothetical protein